MTHMDASDGTSTASICKIINVLSRINPLTIRINDLCTLILESLEYSKHQANLKHTQEDVSNFLYNMCTQQIFTATLQLNSELWLNFFCIFRLSIQTGTKSCEWVL